MSQSHFRSSFRVGPSWPHVPRFWAIWALGFATAAAVTAAAWDAPGFPGDLTVARALQALSWLPLTALLRLVNFAGSVMPTLVLVLVILAALLVTGYLDLFLVFAGACALRASGIAIMLLADRPRPSDVLLRVTRHEASPSFPSGHVFSAVLFYGLLAVIVEATGLPRPLRRAIQLLCAVALLLMGPAQVFAGTSWPSDALGGYLWGALLLAALVHVARQTGWLPRPRRRRGRPRR